MDSDYFPPLSLQIAAPGLLLTDAILSFLFVFFLLLLACALAAGGRALFTLTSDELSEVRAEKTTADRFLHLLYDRPHQTRLSLAAVQSFLNLSIGVVGWHAVALLWPGALYTAAAITVVILCGALLLCLFCGLMPRWMVRGGNLRVARATAAVLKFSDFVCAPLSRRLATLPPPAPRNETPAGEPTTIISKESADEHEMLEEIGQFYNKTADEIMVPRVDMKAISARCTFREALDLIIGSGFSRIPIYEESDDNITGILYAKDILLYIRDPKDFEWQKLIRPAYFVPETKKIEDLLEEFRANKVHIAIVVDEFGCASGLVTMEDIIEEIVGDITDEYDTEQKPFFRLPDGSYIFEGKTQLNDFFRETDIDEEEFGDLTEDVETLTGLLLKIKGTLPRRRETIDYGRYRFRVLEANERRVLKVKFYRILTSSAENAKT